MVSFILQDWAANANNPKGRFVMVFFRLCQAIRSLPLGLWILGSPILAVYVLLIHWVMGIELDYRSRIGSGLSLQHAVGLVVHRDVVIGVDCTLRNGVTLGIRTAGSGVPVLGDRVDVGSNAVILGPVTVGSRVVIGASSVVIHDVEPGNVMAGNPARIIRSAALL